MEIKRTYEVKEHYLVELDKKSMGGIMTSTHIWEVFIAVDRFTYRGKAIEQNMQKREIPWTEIKDPDNGLEAMIKAIEVQMSR